MGNASDRVVSLTAAEASGVSARGSWAVAELGGSGGALSSVGDSAGAARPVVLTQADIELDPARRTVVRAGREVDLTRKEFGVLHALMAARGDVVATEELLAAVWDANVDPFSNIVRMTVMKVRRKLGPPGVVETVAGVGYRM